MTSLDADHFRTRLLDDRRRVADALEYLHLENPGSMEDEAEEMPLDNHLAETATVTLDRQIDYSLEEHSAHVLADIDAALQRIDGGTFGTCVTCGKPIPPERLEAIPYAAQCIDCRRQEERG